MGNDNSRFAERARFVEDMNCAHANYLGGKGFNDMEAAEDCPADKLVLAHCSFTNPSKVFPINPTTLRGPNDAEQRYHQIYDEIINSIQAKKAKLEREFDRQVDPKAIITGQRFPKQEAFRQIDSALESF